MSVYHTISKESEGLYKEKGSKFISFAYPVTSEENVKERLTEIKKVFHDARHYCYAWILGMDNQKWRSNDDGEPSHSAGDPILGQIRSFGLTNVLVVVVRYFGGIKLGVGGLINAYKTAAELALSQVDKTPIHEVRDVSFLFDYDGISIVEKMISDFDIEVLERNFEEKCKIVGKIKKDKRDHFERAVKDLYQIEIKIEK